MGPLPPCVTPGWDRAVLLLGSQPPRGLTWKSLSLRLGRAGPSFLNKAGGWLPASCPEPRAGRPKAGIRRGWPKGWAGLPPWEGGLSWLPTCCSCPKILVASGHSSGGQDVPPLPLGSLNLFPARRARHTPSPAPHRADVGAQAWEVKTHQGFKVLLGYIGSLRLA